MAWFRKPKQKLKAEERRELPTDVFEKCPDCGEILYSARLEQNLNVCPSCGFHVRIGADDYIGVLIDEGTFEARDTGLRSADPLDFTDLKPYPERLEAAETRSAHGEAIVTGTGRLDGLPVCLAVMDFSFIGGSMGAVVGEKIARLGRHALGERQPLIIVSASGGARMMEGILSLMQMAKTSAVLARLHAAGVPYISVMTDPTTGGVTASYAMLGDVQLAEPGALIGFAGPRVIEQTINQALPEGFQRSEFLLEHGMIDAIVDRRELKVTLSRLLRHMLGEPERVADQEAGSGDASAAGSEGGSQTGFAAAAGSAPSSDGAGPSAGAVHGDGRGSAAGEAADAEGEGEEPEETEPARGRTGGRGKT